MGFIMLAGILTFYIFSGGEISGITMAGWAIAAGLFQIAQDIHDKKGDSKNEKDT